MKRFAGTLIVVMGILLGAQTVAAQEWSQPWARARIEKSPRHSEWVPVKHDGRNVQTLVVYSFHAVASGTPAGTYAAWATPITANQTGNRSFCSVADAVVRFSTAALTTCAGTETPLQ
ncbi:MAG: hypothetical protein ABSC07_18290 [Terriglobales bacterium]